MKDQRHSVPHSVGLRVSPLSLKPHSLMVLPKGSAPIQIVDGDNIWNKAKNSVLSCSCRSFGEYNAHIQRCTPAPHENIVLIFYLSATSGHRENLWKSEPTCWKRPSFTNSDHTDIRRTHEKRTLPTANMAHPISCHTDTKRISSLQRPFKRKPALTARKHDYLH